jgi:hypothetical protein
LKIIILPSGYQFPHNYGIANFYATIDASMGIFQNHGEDYSEQFP